MVVRLLCSVLAVPLAATWANDHMMSPSRTGLTKEAAMERGLISYGVDAPDLFSRAALYVDRILRGAKPAELPGAGTDQIRVGHQP